MRINYIARIAVCQPVKRNGQRLAAILAASEGQRVKQDTEVRSILALLLSDGRDIMESESCGKWCLRNERMVYR